MTTLRLTLSLISLYRTYEPRTRPFFKQRARRYEASLVYEACTRLVRPTVYPPSSTLVPRSGSPPRVPRNTNTVCCLYTVTVTNQDLELTPGTFVIHTLTKPGSHEALPEDLGGGVGSLRTGPTAKGAAMRNPRQGQGKGVTHSVLHS